MSLIGNYKGKRSQTFTVFENILGSSTLSISCVVGPTYFQTRGFYSTSSFSRLVHEYPTSRRIDFSYCHNSFFFFSFFYPSLDSLPQGSFSSTGFERNSLSPELLSSDYGLLPGPTYRTYCGTYWTPLSTVR